MDHPVVMVVIYCKLVMVELLQASYGCNLLQAAQYSEFDLPATLESYATPTPQMPLSLAAATSPAQRVP